MAEIINHTPTKRLAKLAEELREANVYSWSIASPGDAIPATFALLVQEPFTQKTAEPYVLFLGQRTNHTSTTERVITISMSEELAAYLTNSYFYQGPDGLERLFFDISVDQLHSAQLAMQEVVDTLGITSVVQPTQCNDGKHGKDIVYYRVEFPLPLQQRILDSNTDLAETLGFDYSEKIETLLEYILTTPATRIYEDIQGQTILEGTQRWELIRIREELERKQELSDGVLKKMLKPEHYRLFLYATAPIEAPSIHAGQYPNLSTGRIGTIAKKLGLPKFTKAIIAKISGQTNQNSQ